uniref:Thioredoxin domain-containing protein n=1 Tax=Globisporangium ultimum (strain ATCC 200006 / CBS 805.95 / DAOM BR144) TaxID=431595 RepID=K3XBV9_GLOUD
MGAMDVLKKWDFYKKIPEDLTVSTLPGVSLSIAGCFIMFILFILEFNSYLTVDYKYDIVMDEGLDQTMRINFNITVPDLPCEFASVDVSDMTGTRKHNMTKNIYKIRIDHKGRHVGLANEEQLQPVYADDAEYGELPESDAVVTMLDENTFEPFLKEHHYVAVDYYAPWCIWCQRLEPVWTRVAKTLPSLHYGQRMRVASVNCQEHPNLCMKQFIRAYPTILFYKDGDISPVEMYLGDRTVEAFVDKFKQLFAGETDAVEERKKKLHEQDKQEAQAKGVAIARATGPEGCRLFGHLYVKRVPGNFHVHLSNPAYSMDHSLVNATHTVNELWFGEHLTPREISLIPQSAQLQLYTHRLEGEEFTAYNKNHTYVHYIKVVTNSYVQKSEAPINIYKYTAHSNEYLETDDLPSIMFRYDLSPMSVRITEAVVPFYHFVTSACAIIGGVFTVIGIIDQLIHQTVRAMNKKVL